MERGSNELQKAFWRADNPNAELPDTDFWPTESRGDGKVRKNNARTGAAQGKSSLIRKAPCRLCGWLNDLTAIDHSGGSLDGEGAGGSITTATASVTLLNGTVHTENYGTQALRKNSGCALCFSKNSTSLRIDVQTYVNPWDRIQPLGF
jgi:hypothetical protein